MASRKPPKQTPSPESHRDLGCDTLLDPAVHSQLRPGTPPGQRFCVTARDSSEAVYSDPLFGQTTKSRSCQDVPYSLHLPPETPNNKHRGASDSPVSSPYTPTPKPKQKGPGPLTLSIRPANSSKFERNTPEEFDHSVSGPLPLHPLNPEPTRTADKMSKSKDGQAETYHQEYIASSRYRNDLPPPEMPPKLLEIPHDGLERLLTPGYTSNMARREEPNVDVDAEGGMPIDLVGMPGLHLGDESAIMAPENPPPLDTADLPLLMTLEQLKNPAPKDTNVSFLRRTQYISTGTRVPSNPNAAPTKGRPRQPSKPKVSHDDPEYIKKYIQKGFDISNPKSKHTGEDTASRIKGHTATKTEHDAWAHPVHPDNPKLKPVGFYPVLPDLQGFTDPGGYVQFKFDKPPVQDDSGKRDRRMDVAVLHPSEPDEKICQDYATRVSLHRTNPELYPDPGPLPYDYDLFLPEKKEAAKDIIASLDQTNVDRDDQGLYTHEGPDGARFHRYDRIRTYATSSQALSIDKQRDLALSIYDPAEVKGDGNAQPRQKAAYYYPIMGKTRLTQDRARNIGKVGVKPKEEQIHQVQMGVRDPDEAESYKRALHRAAIDPRFADSMPPPPAEAEPEEPEEPEETEGQENPEENREEEAHEDNEPTTDNQPPADDAGQEEEDRMSDE